MNRVAQVQDRLLVESDAVEGISYALDGVNVCDGSIARSG